MNKIDKQGMYKVYDMWPEIARESFKTEYDSPDLQNVDHIVFAGMGGSGAIGDIFSSILSKSKIHVCVVKGYHLPQTVDKNTLVVATSISGNTLETLTVLDAATKTRCNVLAFSSGGKISEYCKKYNINYQNIQQIHSPRASFVNYLYSMLKVLSPILPIKKNDIVKSLDELNLVGKNISSNNLSETNTSLSLASWLDEIPMIYYPWGLQAAAIRFKNSLQENSKLHAMAEDVVESCHNGMVAWEKNANVKPILIEGVDDYYKTKEIWKIIKEFFNIHAIDYRQISTVKGTILCKLMCLIYILDMCTIYRAVLSKTDPSPINAIDFIKKNLYHDSTQFT